jgi:hypothetical protein
LRSLKEGWEEEKIQDFWAGSLLPLRPSSYLLEMKEMQRGKGMYWELPNQPMNNGPIITVLKKRVFFFSFLANLKYFREIYEQKKHGVKRSVECTQE